MSRMDEPYVSVVVPVHNEQECLPELVARLKAALAGLGKPWEIILVDDGSRDGSLGLMRGFHEGDPGGVRVIVFNRNYGQHAAVFAGLQHSRGRIVVTLDADLQNPPEEIPKLVAKIEEGHDVVGGWRRRRRDNFARRILSSLNNRLTAYTTGVPLRDFGCMLRAYRRDVVDQVKACREISTYIPALCNRFARSVAEVEVAHAERKGGASKYGIRRLLNLHYDLLTGFSVLPLKFITVLGLIVAPAGLMLSVYLFARRIWYGIVDPAAIAPEQGIFTLFAVLFFFMGAMFLALGIMGEYIGRIYNEVRDRPRFVIKEIVGEEREGTSG